MQSRKVTVTNSTSRALVPVKSRSVVSKAAGVKDNDFQLVDGRVDLQNRDDVKEQLPDILGRVLARAWLDKEFLTPSQIDFMIITTKLVQH